MSHPGFMSPQSPLQRKHRELGWGRQVDEKRLEGVRKGDVMMEQLLEEKPKIKMRQYTKKQKMVFEKTEEANGVSTPQQQMEGKRQRLLSNIILYKDCDI